MPTRSLAAAVAAWALVQTSAGTANPKLDKAEGELWAADCLVTSAEVTCTRQALRNGAPAGVLAKGKFTMLLVDGRVLADACEVEQGSAQVRASGKLHWDGQAMTPLTIESWCAGEWRQMALPQSGTNADSAGGGDE